MRSKTELLDELALSKGDTAKLEINIYQLVHELQVHKAELEAQNEELRQTQQQLEEARDRYANLYDFSPAGYLTLDRKGKVLELNLTAAAMLGRERSNLVGRYFSALLMQGEEPTFWHHLQQTFLAQCDNADQCNIATELKIRPAHAAPRAIRMESWAFTGGNTCRTVIIDITHQCLAAEALQRNLAAQEALLKAIPAVVFYQDTELRFIAVSQAFADFVGYKIADLIGKTAYDVLPQKIAEDFQRTSRQVLDEGNENVVPEYAMPDKNGNQIIVSVVRVPYRDANGKIIGMVGAGIDITAIKMAANLNADLLKENRALTHSLFKAQEEERSHLARELHDELGQWLTAIQAEAQVICNITDGQSKIQDSAQSISNSASSVHEVIRGMLRHLRPSMLDELGLADSLRELQRQWCRSHPNMRFEFNLEVSIDGLGENINITVYRLIQEALNNVASHAHAGKVVVTLRREAENAAEGELLLLDIEDDGAGFDTQQATEGMGVLGMRERVIAAGGRFAISSQPGKGTHIQAALPLKFKESR